MLLPESDVLEKLQLRLPEIAAKITAAVIEEITETKIEVTYHPDGVVMMGHNGPLGVLVLSFPVLGAVAAHIAGMFQDVVPTISVSEYERLLLDSFREVANKRGFQAPATTA